MFAIFAFSSESWFVVVKIQYPIKNVHRIEANQGMHGFKPADNL